ncbi:hypothetical protein CSKR_101751 [Clonorchis sinensis]|uniref:Uncharacterized protein n=1 Tax=Clonorchis sinensis TaxID=79923 RepID=A0A3R7C1R8_CLOSI|nr:hypothetical protein CSKR_101751 [Clonorchis sinensis]
MNRINLLVFFPKAPIIQRRTRQNYSTVTLTCRPIWVPGETDLEPSRIPQCEFTDRKVRGSNPTSASRLPCPGLGNLAALMLPSGGMAARRRKGVLQLKE